MEGWYVHITAELWQQNQAVLADKFKLCRCVPAATRRATSPTHLEQRPDAAALRASPTLPNGKTTFAPRPWAGDKGRCPNIRVRLINGVGALPAISLLSALPCHCTAQELVTFCYITVVPATKQPGHPLEGKGISCVQPQTAGTYCPWKPQVHAQKRGSWVAPTPWQGVTLWRQTQHQQQKRKRKQTQDPAAEEEEAAAPEPEEEDPAPAFGPVHHTAEWLAGFAAGRADGY